MKKYLLASAAVLLGAAGMAAPSAADVFVTGFTFKFVTIDIDEVIIKDKDVTINVINRRLTGGTAAEAVGVHNQRTDGNILTWQAGRTELEGEPVPPTGLPAYMTAAIRLSFNDNTGVVMWNQDVGNNTNQANVVTAAVVNNAFFTEASDSAAQYINGNFIQTLGVFPETNRSSTINASVNNNVGIVFLNQNSGYASNQYNSATLAIGIRGAQVAMAEADLGQWNTGNRTIDIFTERFSTIAGSVNNNSGVTAVNQNAGNYNNQAFKLSFAGGLQ